MRCFANGFPVSETLKFLNRYNFKIQYLNNPTNVFRSFLNIIFLINGQMYFFYKFVFRFDKELPIYNEDDILEDSLAEPMQL